MTTMTTPVRDLPAPAKPQVLRLLRSERIKLTSTKTWWLFGIGTFVLTAITVLSNIGQHYQDLTNQGGPDGGGGHTPLSSASVGAIRDASADIFTSGQYFGGLFVMLLGTLLITNEYYHQTATTTFLATPRRSSVVVSKFLMTVIIAALGWLLTTVIAVIGGSIFWSANGVDSQLFSGTVGRAIIVNLLMFVLWAIFGLGLGVLIRSQIGATVTGALIYTVGTLAVIALFGLIRTFIYHHDGVFRGLVLFPEWAALIASSSSATNLPGNVTVQWWVGVIVMVAYAAVMAGIGTSILRKRDIS